METCFLGGMKAMLNPKNGEDTTDVPIVPPVVAARRCHESPRDSPALPKRQPVSRLESLDPPKESKESSTEYDDHSSTVSGGRLRFSNMFF